MPKGEAWPRLSILARIAQAPVAICGNGWAAGPRARGGSGDQWGLGRPPGQGALTASQTPMELDVPARQGTHLAAGFIPAELLAMKDRGIRATNVGAVVPSPHARREKATE